MQRALDHGDAGVAWVGDGVALQLRPDTLLDEGELGAEVPRLGEEEAQQAPLDELERRPGEGRHALHA
jgi:hypothetical protein